MATEMDGSGGRPGAGRTSGHPDPLHAGAEAPGILEPSEAEIEEWAARERQRREAWLKGPTEEEKAAWARRERVRRLAELARAQDEVAVERDFLRLRYPREAQLAAEGAASLTVNLVRRGLGTLVRAGREWEEGFVQPSRPRRVTLDEEDC